VPFGEVDQERGEALRPAVYRAAVQHAGGLAPPLGDGVPVGAVSARVGTEELGEPVIRDDE
jgi:hypothetical protein